MTDDELNKDRPETIKFLQDLDVSTPFLVLGNDYVEWLRAVLNYKPVYNFNIGLVDKVNISVNSNTNSNINSHANVNSVGNSGNIGNGDNGSSGDSKTPNNNKVITIADTDGLPLIYNIEICDEASGCYTGKPVEKPSWWKDEYGNGSPPVVTEIELPRLDEHSVIYRNTLIKGYILESRFEASKVIDNYLKDNNFVYFTQWDRASNSIYNPLFYVYKDIGESVINDIATLYNQSFCTHFSKLSSRSFDDVFAELKLDNEQSGSRYSDITHNMIYKFSFGHIFKQADYLYNLVSFSVGELNYIYTEPAKFYFENVWGK